MELADGEALFTVEHDENNPFVVTIGRTRLIDAGTVFNVVHQNGSLDVAVAEGSVIYEQGKNGIRLNAGDALSRSTLDAEPVLRRASPHAIGAWQSGLLQYDNAPLDRIARDLGRNIGQPIHAAPGSDRMHFTGTLVIDGPAEQVLPRAGALLGVTFTPAGDAWKMTPADDTIP
ncbi:MAG: FecR domain-containing protein [Novosphingobium sp.]